MAAVVLRKLTPLTSSFVASRPVLITAGRFALDFTVQVFPDPPATVEWYPEFSGTLAADGWFREVSEEVSAGGVILMAQTIRTFAVNGGTQLTPEGIYQLSAQLVREAQFARIQIRCSAGAASAGIVCPFGMAVN